MWNVLFHELFNDENEQQVIRWQDNNVRKLENGSDFENNCETFWYLATMLHSWLGGNSNHFHFANDGKHRSNWLKIAVKFICLER